MITTYYSGCSPCCSGAGFFNVSGAPCCSGIPSILHATVTNITGCGCLAGTYELDFQGFAGGGSPVPGYYWQSPNYTLCGTPNSFWQLVCVPNPFGGNPTYVWWGGIGCVGSGGRIAEAGAYGYPPVGIQCGSGLNITIGDTPTQLALVPPGPATGANSGAPCGFCNGGVEMVVTL